MSDDIKSKRKIRKVKRKKGWQFWVLFVAVPIIVVLAASLAFYVLYPKKKSPLDQGLLFSRLNRHDDAVSEFKKILEKNPDNRDAYFLLGNSYLSLKEFDDAEIAFQNALRISPNFSQAHYQLTVIAMTRAYELRKDGESESIVLKKLLEAEDICSEIIKKDPRFINSYILLGGIHLKRGLVDKAIKDYKLLLSGYNKFANGHVTLATLYLKKRELDFAEKECKLVLTQIEPDNLNAKLLLSTIYIQKKKYDEAIVMLKQILEKEPDHMKTLEMICIGYVKKEEIQKAILLLEQALPDNSKIWGLYKLGTLYMDIGSYDKAILTYKKGTENFPENYLLWCNLAVAYQISEDLVNAKNACEKAIKIKPNGLITNLCMVYIFMANGEYENAKQHVECMTRIDDVLKNMYFDLIELCGQKKDVSEKVSYHLARTLIYTNDKWYKRVLQECNEATKLFPGNMVAYNIQVHTLKLTKEFDKAIEVCNKMIELEPENPTYYIKLAKVYSLKGENDDAIKHYRRAITVAPDNVNAHMSIGILLWAKDLLDESVDAYRKVIELDPEFIPAFNNLAWLYAFKMNDIDNGLKMAKRAKELDPINPVISDTLAWIYYLDGKYDKALSLLKDAVQEAVWNPTIRYHLGMAYYKNGFQREAIVEIQNALKINNTFPEAEEAKKQIDEWIASRTRYR